jgi:hypothetical protein
MTKRLIGAVVLAVVASAITASVVVVVGQDDEPREVEVPPSEALKPSEITKIPPGTPVADLNLPLDYGRFRILPPGSVPDQCGVPQPPDAEQARVDIEESDTLDAFRDHDLFFEPPYIPDGWELTEAHAETVIWDDGSQTGSMLGLSYERPGYFYIRIIRAPRAPTCQIERVAHTPESQHAFTLGEIRAVPVVFQHQAAGEPIQALLQVSFVMDNVLTGIESVAIDFDELIKIADGLIAESQEASS